MYDLGNDSRNPHHPPLQESVKRQGSADSNEASPLTNLQSAPSWRRKQGVSKFPPVASMTQNSLIPPPPRRIPFNSLDSINYTGARLQSLFSLSLGGHPPLPEPIPAALCRPVEQPCLNPSDHPEWYPEIPGFTRVNLLAAKSRSRRNRYRPCKHSVRSRWPMILPPFRSRRVVLPGTEDSYSYFSWSINFICFVNQYRKNINNLITIVETVIFKNEIYLENIVR